MSGWLLVWVRHRDPHTVLVTFVVLFGAERRANDGTGGVLHSAGGGEPCVGAAVCGGRVLCGRGAGAVSGGTVRVDTGFVREHVLGAVLGGVLLSVRIDGSDAGRLWGHGRDVLSCGDGGASECRSRVVFSSGGS